jgi:hypothetical protein
MSRGTCAQASRAIQCVDCGRERGPDDDRRTLLHAALFVSATVSQDSQRSTSHRSVVRSGPPPTCSAVLPRGTRSEMWRLRWSSAVRIRYIVVIGVTLGTVPNCIQFLLIVAPLSTNRTVQRHAGDPPRPDTVPAGRVHGPADRCAPGAASGRRHGRAPPKRLRTRRRF